MPAIKLATIATVAQGIASFSTLAVGLVVARELGAAALGQFGFLLVILTTFVAVQTAWVGDALTVLARDDSLRAGVATSQWLHMLAALVLAPLAAVIGARVGLVTALLFGLATVAWELREYGRRALIADLAFGRQIVVDLTYLVAVGCVLFSLAASEALTPATTWVSIIVGAAASSFAALALLPRSRRLLRPQLAMTGVSAVARFGAWRAAQACTGYIGQIGFRYAVLIVGSFELLGAIEAARIIVAPLLILFASLMNVLLPVFAGREAAIRPRALAMCGGGLMGLCVLYGALVLGMSQQVAEFLYNGAVLPPASALVAWLAVAATVALATPYTVSVLLADGSRAVFNAKVLGTAVGLVAATTACFADQPLLAPLGLACGNLLSAWILIRGSLRHANPVAALARSGGSAS